jgi:hypothetical protein
LCARENMFTYTEAGRLMGLCWTKAIETPPESGEMDSPSCFLLHDPYYHSLSDRKHLGVAFAKSIARTCRSQFPERQLTLCARHSDRELTAALDQLRCEECADTKIDAIGMQTASVTS